MTAARARRRAVLMLGALAAAMLLAGVLPWATGGEAGIRFLALPLLLAGLIVLGATLRVWAAGRAPAPSAPPVERGCDGCVCGRQGPCAADQPAAQSPAGQSARSPGAAGRPADQPYAAG